MSSIELADEVLALLAIGAGDGLVSVQPHARFSEQHFTRFRRSGVRTLSDAARRDRPARERRCTVIVRFHSRAQNHAKVVNAGDSAVGASTARVRTRCRATSRATPPTARDETTRLVEVGLLHESKTDYRLDDELLAARPQPRRSRTSTTLPIAKAVRR